jgi:uncharacterized membrane protein
VETRIPFEGGYELPRMRSLRKPRFPLRLDRLGLLIGVVLLSLGLWAAVIWAAIVIFNALA